MLSLHLTFRWPMDRYKILSIKYLIFFIVGLSPMYAYSQGGLFTDDATARSVFYSGNMHEAVKHFNELLRVDSMNYEYNMLDGYAYLHSNVDKSRAVVHLERALKNPRADQLIYYDLGKAYMLNYRFDDAIDAFNTFISKGLKLQKSDIPAQRYIEMCENAKLLTSLRANVTIENIGTAVNTAYPDYNAYVNAGENVLFFSSKQQANAGSQPDFDGYKMADVYCAERVNGVWQPAKRLQAPVNSGLQEDVVSASSDGETLLLYFNNEKGFDDIFITHKEKKQFTRPEILSLTVNSQQREEAAAISPDGNWIFFSSDRPGGYGGLDLYFSRRLPNGEWSNAKNAGPSINTEYDDSYPYLAPDGITLYFSSQGHNSMGGFDLFRTMWNPEEQFFSVPENLASPINTPDDNKTISVTKSGRYAYIADFRAGSTGDLDIYKVTFLDVPAPYCPVKGVVAHVDSATMMSEMTKYHVVIREAGTKKQVGIYRPNVHDGSFTFILQPGFYLVDFYIDNKLKTTSELVIDDREPDQQVRVFYLE